MNDLISVIMPAYNCEKYIAEAIQSVLNQTYIDFELIIIDDCSKDNTLDIIKDFKSKDSRIKVYESSENSGVSKTRNRGIFESSGEWVAFLDSDDIWDNKKLEKQIKYAKKINAGFVFTGVSYIDENGNKYTGIFDAPVRVSYKELLKQNVISCSSVMIKKSYFSDFNIKMENDDIHEDFCAWLKILRNIDFAYGVNEPLLIYRISKKSKSGNKIKSLKMAYKTYRFINISRIKSCLLMFFYIVRNLKKYRNINK